jgi:hypothetical protein
MADAKRKVSLGKSSGNSVFCHLPQTTSLSVLSLVNTNFELTQRYTRQAKTDNINVLNTNPNEYQIGVCWNQVTE